MFEKSLQDLVRGMRANAGREREYVFKCMEEIQNELQSHDLDLKSNAIAKLEYLYMLGYDCQWAYFHAIEVMASTKISEKRIGYCAAAMLFTNNPQILSLCINLFQKDLRSTSVAEINLALTTVSQIMTFDLSRELFTEILLLTNHTQAIIRKKALAALYHVFVCNPDTLLSAFTKLKSMLDDNDPAVVTVVVNVFYELARTNPKQYLPLAPALFKLLQGSKNNWMKIKVVKLLSLLAPEEPRLARKILPQLSEILENTSAISILYEVQKTVFSSRFIDESLAKSCLEKCLGFLAHKDYNLRYIALISMFYIPTSHSHLFQNVRSQVRDCLNEDCDPSIRKKAVELLIKFTNKLTFKDDIETIAEIVSMNVSKREKEIIVDQLIMAFVSNTFDHVVDFQWAFRLLFSLCQLDYYKSDSLLSFAFSDLLLRVPRLGVDVIRHIEKFNCPLSDSLLAIILTLCEYEMPKDFHCKAMEFLMNHLKVCNETQKVMIGHVCFKVWSTHRDPELKQILIKEFEDCREIYGIDMFYGALLHFPFEHDHEFESTLRPVALNAQSALKLPKFIFESEKIFKDQQTDESTFPERIRLVPSKLRQSPAHSPAISIRKDRKVFDITSSVDLDSIPIVQLDLTAADDKEEHPEYQVNKSAGDYPENSLLLSEQSEKQTKTTLANVLDRFSQAKRDPNKN